MTKYEQYKDLWYNVETLPDEVWKPIAGYDGLFEISSFGRVKSFRKKEPYILKEVIGGNNNYKMVQFKVNNIRKVFLIHRLVAEHFINNDDKTNKIQVNHIDENIENNFAGTPENNFTDGNLEWCTPKYNANYGNRNKKVSEKALKKNVKQFSKEGVFIKEWSSLTEIQRQTGFKKTNISSCCRGKYKQAYGYIWKFKKEVV